MLLKKPYGILIKHFKLIHLLLLLPMIYFAHKLHNMTKFLSDFVASDLITNINDLAGTYINGWMILAIILILGIVIMIFFLMMSKNKSTKFYLFIIIYYVANIVLLIFARNILYAINHTTIDIVAPRMLRDFTRISYFLGIPIIIYNLIRGIGFDIKSFNFAEDLVDLDIDEEDTELVELNINFDKDELERKVRSTLRELKYYVLENKFVFTCLIILVAIILLVLLFKNVKDYNQNIKIGQAFQYGSFNVVVEDSLISKRDFTGNVISDGKYYLALKISFENLSDDTLTIVSDDFSVYLNDTDAIYPILDKSGNFIDFANPYYGDGFKPHTKKTIALVYELNSGQIQENYSLKILMSTYKEKGNLIGRYKYVNIVPKIEQESLIENTANIGDSLKFTSTPLLNTSIQINGYDIAKKYEYEYDFCKKEDDCIKSKGVVGIDYSKSKGGVLLILDSKLLLDENSLYSTYGTNERNFYTDFMTLEYTNSSGKTFSSTLTDKTPSAVKDKQIFQVKGDIGNAEKIVLLIKARTNIYEIKLK